MSFGVYGRVIENVFEVLDVNKDGVISLEELESMWSQVDFLIKTTQNKIEMTAQKPAAV